MICMQDICAALVSLHLLDSRPLDEILNIFLLQRSKRLQAVLLWKPDVEPGDKGNASSNHPGAPGMVSLREVTQVMKDALKTITETVCTSRALFQSQPDTSFLLLRVLESIQSDDGNISNLPIDLHVSTPMILGLLTSSATFQLLPPDVRSYRPYVDLDTCSASLTQPMFLQKLQEWFHGSCERWETSSAKRLSGLVGVKEVWTCRTSIKRLITTSNLSEEEKGYLASNMDTLCHDQIVDIWKKRLSHAEGEFKLWLHSQVIEDTGSDQSERSPLFFVGLLVIRCGRTFVFRFLVYTRPDPTSFSEQVIGRFCIPKVSAYFETTADWPFTAARFRTVNSGRLCSNDSA
jgi:hypothetical protein